MLVILTALANFVFALHVGPNQDLVRWNQQTAESNGQAMNGGLYLLWPGMLIIWGAAWLGFLITLLRKDFRSALIVFLLTAAVWFLPLALYVVSIIAGA